MQVNQIYEFVNEATKEVLGEEALVNEDLSNIVDIGTAIFNAEAVDRYVKSLVNHIGKVIFVNRVYKGLVPSVIMDGWEYGSILEKITVDLPEAQENESWELNDGESYDQNIFVKPKVSAKFFNKKVTFEIQLSFTERQVKQSFSNAEQLNGFMSMLFNSIEKSMTIKLESLVMRTINTAIAETINDDYGAASLGSKSGVKAINLLYLFNQKFRSGDSDVPLTAAESVTNADFIRFASYVMGMTADRMRKVSKLFNVGGKDRFTPNEFLHVVLLSDFANGARAYLYSDTFHELYTKLPEAEVVPFWQGSGTDYSFSSTSKIDVTVPVGDSTVTVTTSGILGVMFDRSTIGVTNLDRRVTTHYNAKAEFYNNWYKFDSGYFYDGNENCVVFFVADAE